MINAFAVGVEISMVSNASGVLGVMLRELGLTHAAAERLSNSLGGIKTAALGAIGVFAGFTALKAIAHVIEDARELNHQLEATKQLGGDFARNIEQTRLTAFRTADLVPTMLPSQAVKLSREVGLTLGHPDAAAEMLPQAAKAAYVISHYTGEDQEGIVKNLIRIADDRGQVFTKGADGEEHVDSRKLAAEFEAMTKGLILAGGMAGGSSGMLQYIRQAGVTAKTQTAESVYAAGTELSVMMGPSKAGTAETGLFQQFIGGTMTKKVAEHLTDAGFMKQDEWHSGKSGGVVVNTGVSKRYDGMMADPAAYFSTGEGGRLIQGYAAKEGITAIQAVFALFGRQTVQRLISDIQTNKPQIERSRGIFHEIPDIQKQYGELMAHDLDANILAFTDSWKGLMEALGEGGIPLAISVMHDLGGAIHVFTSFFAEHPLATQILMGLATAVAALVTAASAMAVAQFVSGALGIGSSIRWLSQSASLFAGGGAGAVGIRGAIGGLAALASSIAAFAAGIGGGLLLGKGIESLDLHPDQYGAAGRAVEAGREFLGTAHVAPGGDAHPLFDPIRRALGTTGNSHPLMDYLFGAPTTPEEPAYIAPRTAGRRDQELPPIFAPLGTTPLPLPPPSTAPLPDMAPPPRSFAPPSAFAPLASPSLPTAAASPRVGPTGTAADPIHSVTTVTNVDAMHAAAAAHVERQLTTADPGPTSGDARDAAAFGGYGGGF